MEKRDKADSGKRPASRGRNAPTAKNETGRPRGRRGGYGAAGAAGAGTEPAEAASNRRARGTSSTTGRGSRTARQARMDESVDAALSGFFDSELEGEPEEGERESEQEPAAAFGTGRAELHEDLETDGPVMGGPGMIRMGGDRAVSSGTGGLAAGEDLDPVAEGDYWRENFRRSPYFAAETESTYEPAYRFGWKKAGQFEYRNRGFEEIELDLQRQWESSLPEQPWDEARSAVRDAWDRARREE